jgi:hypothetical protein
MRNTESEMVYFRRLAVRCRRASQECFEPRAQEEFRKLAEEFAGKADELARTYYHTGAYGTGVGS